MRGDRALDHIPKVGTCLVRTSLVEHMAGKACLGLLLALGRVGLGEKGAQRFLGRLCAIATGIAATLLGDLDGKTRLFRGRGMIDYVLGLVEPQHQKRRSENRTGNLIEFKTVHIGRPGDRFPVFSPCGRGN
jgi:hypothetical protein